MCTSNKVFLVCFMLVFITLTLSLSFFLFLETKNKTHLKYESYRKKEKFFFVSNYLSNDHCITLVDFFLDACVVSGLFFSVSLRLMKEIRFTDVFSFFPVFLMNSVFFRVARLFFL